MWKLARGARVVGDLPGREWPHVAARLRGAVARLRGAVARLRGAVAPKEELEPEQHRAAKAPGISQRRDSSLGRIGRLV